jgi:hypothetical protein
MTGNRLLYMPQSRGLTLLSGDFRSANVASAGRILVSFLAHHLAPNLQKLPDGGSAVVE